MSWFQTMSAQARLGVILLGLGFAACGSEQATPEPVQDVVPPAAELDRSAPSNGESFVLRWQASAEAPPLNEEYGFAFALEAPDGKPLDIPIEDLRLDARMPHHGHGMNQDPVLERSGPGRYSARGLRLHMTGYWEVYLDVVQGPLTERAEFNLELH